MVWVLKTPHHKLSLIRTPICYRVNLSFSPSSRSNHNPNRSPGREDPHWHQQTETEHFHKVKDSNSTSLYCSLSFDILSLYTKIKLSTETVFLHNSFVPRGRGQYMAIHHLFSFIRHLLDQSKQSS